MTAAGNETAARYTVKEPPSLKSLKRQYKQNYAHLGSHAVLHSSLCVKKPRLAIVKKEHASKNRKVFSRKSQHEISRMKAFNSINKLLGVSQSSSRTL